MARITIELPDNKIDYLKDKWGTSAIETDLQHNVESLIDGWIDSDVESVYKNKTTDEKITDINKIIK